MLGLTKDGLTTEPLNRATVRLGSSLTTLNNTMSKMLYLKWLHILLQSIRFQHDQKVIG